jgi:hypothetical protein
MLRLRTGVNENIVSFLDVFTKRVEDILDGHPQ